MPLAQDSAKVIQGCFRSLARRTNLEPAVASAVEQRALLGSSDAFLALRAGERELAASALLELWSSSIAVEVRRFHETASALRTLAENTQRQLDSLSEHVAQAVRPLNRPLADFAHTIRAHFDVEEYTAWSLLYHQAVEQVITRSSALDPTRTALRALMTRLELSQDDTGRMLGVSGETVRRWERGATGIPADRRAAILAAEAGLRRLQDLFRRERLATAIRRPADLFGGERALDWILRGRIAEVADRYETALLYQA